jgi:regulator of sigma E protease
VNKPTTFYHKIFGLLGLSFVIIVHEFGHFLAAKLFGVGTPIFSIGFGPRLFGYQFGKTLFQLAAIPLGGYVSMNPTELALQPYSHKMIIILAGVFFNVLFTYLVLVYLGWRDNYQTIPIIDSFIPNSPAEKANLEKNDAIIAVDNESIDDDMSLLLETIVSSPGETISLTIERNNKKSIIPIVIGTEHPTLGKGAGWLGIKWKTVFVKKTLLQAIGIGFHKIILILGNIGQFTASLFKKKGGPPITGPLGIMGIAAKSFAISPFYFLFVLGIISINVAIFNLLPIPFLDGGQAVRYTIEAAFGPLPESILYYLTLFFLLLFFLLIIFITLKDINRLRKRG